ncbi:GGDEF domain-containing protein [Listeria monocytogenes]|uniref:GGDEF domain-containing protein n=1 Tax=Listeria monocytogenes TaxID=1639 RepID=UPI0009A4736B|nr:GGDEF domain-containing protein [Listeria monocytogenes]EAC7993797.1 GGDEF domain-containing protein [Listeria monocytogenes]EAE2392421.1 GGDEF domain-containing protein [Listeria monocytogenes]EAG0801148.1 GGDEF domain-containing protein [Listeria monocytogenes]EAG7500919.1 GGDEF domain-containing protein [Listeria monocytogenes]EAG7509422.1 GGDEF domain-containing protein [Listeria monocytogenes]
MFELVNSYIDSLALFLAILFIQGMSFRKIRQYRPNWFQNGSRRLFLSILLGVYYGLAGIYFIYEGAYENNPVIYTNMRILILMVTSVFGGRIPLIFAYLVMLFGRISFDIASPTTSRYVILMTLIFAACLLVTFWKKQRFSRFAALIILNFPAILYYFVNNFDEGRILRGFEIIEYFLLFFVTALLVFYACNYIDKSNLVIQNLTETAMTDSLTNLPNMRFFTQQFGWIFTKSQKRKKSLSLFIIDIDHFKEINDFHGHQAGNTVLAQFSSILKNRTFPPRTMFARIGGEEFAVLLQNVGTEQAALIADFFREEVERAKFPYNPASGKVTVSIGVASASSNFSTTESLFEAADQALYQAKQNGRNQIAVHQGELE